MPLVEQQSTLKSQDTSVSTIAMALDLEPCANCPSPEPVKEPHIQASPNIVENSEGNPESPTSSRVWSPPIPYTSIRELSDDWIYAVEMWYVQEIDSSLHEHQRILHRLVLPQSQPRPGPLQGNPVIYADRERFSIIIKHLWFNVGLMMSHIGDHETAVGAFLESVKKDDRFIIGWYGLAVAYSRLHRFRKSLRALRALLAVLDKQEVSWMTTNLTVDIMGESRDPVIPVTAVGTSCSTLSELKKKKAWIIDRCSVQKMIEIVGTLMKNKKFRHGKRSRSTFHSMEWMLPDHITSPILKALQGSHPSIHRHQETVLIRIHQEAGPQVLRRSLYDINEEDGVDDPPVQKPFFSPSQSAITITSNGISRAVYHQPSDCQPHVSGISPTEEITSIDSQGEEKERPKQGLEMLSPKKSGVRRGGGGGK